MRAAEPVARAVGAVASPVAASAAAVAGPVARAVGAVVTPVGETTAAVVAPVAGVAAPVARAVGAVVAPLGETTTALVAPVTGVVASAEPLTRAVGTVVSPVSRTATAVIAPVVRSALPVIEPAAKALLPPLAKTAATLVEPIVSALPVSALTSVVKPVTGATSPVVGDLLDPVAGGVGRPIVAPVTEAAAAGFVVRRATPLAAAVISPKPEQAQLPATPALGKIARAVVPGRTCATPASPRAHRTTAHRSSAGSHRPGGTPAQPGAPVSSSDVATSAGSGIPPAFLTAGHAPHHFRASPWAHGDFVPLWRPCEPGTGPG